jgi:predicted O-methyltransferase YrrM
MMDITELSKLEEYSIKRKIPIIGSEKGEWLLKKVKEIQPSGVLEIGTANGYSGIILGSEGAKLTTIDKSAPIIVEAKENFKQYGIKAVILFGDGVEVTNKLVEENNSFEANKYYDLIFLDFEKKKYIDILENCLALLKKNGQLIVDNVFMEKSNDFVKLIKDDSRLLVEFVKIGDGMVVIRKY